MKAGLAFGAQRGALAASAAVNAFRGEQASSGFSAQMSIGYTF
jgi:hypothetical protein